jgi:hypothetical protein
MVGVDQTHNHLGVTFQSSRSDVRFYASAKRGAFWIRTHATLEKSTSRSAGTERRNDPEDDQSVDGEKRHDVLGERTFVIDRRTFVIDERPVWFARRDGLR